MPLIIAQETQLKLNQKNCSMCEKTKREKLSEESKKILGRMFKDYNEYSLDECVDFLRAKTQFSSSGDSFFINKLIEFYDKHKKL